MSDEGTTRLCDLDAFRKSALTTRELAWALLKQTRNPEYVSARYGFTVAQMRSALEKIDHDKNA